ncbi:protein SHQ1 homolog [Palaemon carinicauda]|uniref:protein SHQ1 homolog n=1 Tax=Palaemon carinicauda TaxID=392227 RepID=UPI0035B5C04B
MLTPKFEVQQDDNHLMITIFATYAQVTDTEVNIENETFTFYSSPYYLRLTFSGKLIDSEKEKHNVKYDADRGAFVIECLKETPGQHFANLDMLTTLLAPQGGHGVNKPLIEVIDGQNEDSGDEDNDANCDWSYYQTLPDENIVIGGHKYGFANTYSGVFTALQDELKGVVDILDPDNKPVSKRREERLACELETFDEDHYLADYFEIETAQQCVEFIPEFYCYTSDEVKLSEKDKEDMLRLPRKEHLLDKGAKSIVYHGLVDILYAWSYNHRVTLGENCVESAWNISKISATLSWLDSFTQLKHVAVSCVSRSLIYPLIRNWHLAQAVLKDTLQLLSLGPKQVLKCLLEIQRIFNNSEPRYLLNQLYITDYCVWIQRVKDNKLISLADSLRKVKLEKDDVGLELNELEAAAHMVLEDESCLSPEENINTVAASLADMTIIENGAALLGEDNQDAVDGNVTQKSEALSHISDSDSSSSSDSDSDDDEDSDEETDSSDSSDDSSDDDSEKEDSSSDSSDLDSDDDTLSESGDV